MNIIDGIVLGIIVLSIVVGMYRGFLPSVASLGICLLALLLSFVFCPKLTGVIQSNRELTRTLMSFTDASSRVGDLTLSITRVEDLDAGKITEVLERVALPPPLDRLLEVNLTQQVFLPSGLNQVGDYVSQTIVSAFLGVLSYLVCFTALFLGLSIAVNFVKSVVVFPVLKQGDTLAGGLFGLVRGILLCYVVFAILPLMQTMIPLKQISDAVASSQTTPVFNSGNLILAIMNGRL